MDWNLCCFFRLLVDDLLSYVAKRLCFFGIMCFDREDLDWIVKWVGIYFAFVDDILSYVVKSLCFDREDLDEIVKWGFFKL